MVFNPTEKEIEYNAYERPAADPLGAKSSAAVLAKFVHLESIPKDCRDWRVNAANAGALAETLVREWEHALLFRTLATLRTDIPLFKNVDDLRWAGPKADFDSMALRLDAARSGKAPIAARRQGSKRKTPKSSS